MTFDPVLPALLLGVAAAALIVLRAVALPPAIGAGRRAVLRWSGVTIALLLVLLAAARPIVSTAAESEPARSSLAGANVFFVVDRSADSARADFGGAPRMTGIRADIQALIDSHPGARFAVIAFASRPSIDWPLSSDAWSLQPVVEALNPYPGPTAASTEANASAAANVLRYQLISAGQQYPQAPNLVYYLGSGAAESTLPQGEFDTPAIDGGAVLGYGAGPGETALQRIANQLGVQYEQRLPGKELPLWATTGEQPAAVADPASTPRPVELYWLGTMLASLLLLIEIYLAARDLRRSRATTREVLP